MGRTDFIPRPDAGYTVFFRNTAGYCGERFSAWGHIPLPRAFLSYVHAFAVAHCPLLIVILYYTQADSSGGNNLF